MHKQAKPWLCGPTAVVNALEAIGDGCAPSACAVLCGTDEDGTDEDGIAAAIRALGYRPEVVTSWQGLVGELSAGVPVILSVLEYDHWITAIGLLGARVVVVDPAVEVVTVELWTRERTEAAWRGPDGFYGLAVVG